MAEIAQICISLDYPRHLLTLYGNDDFRPSYDSGPFSETEWRAKVAADAREFLARDPGPRQATGPDHSV